MAGSLAQLIAAVVAEGTERRFGHLILVDEPLLRRLRGHEDEALAYAWATGQAAADKVAAEHGRDPEAVAAGMGVPVTRDEEEARAGSAVHLSEYGDKPLGITLHMRNLNAVREAIANEGIAELLGTGDPVPIHLAHELYHHLEAKRLTPGTSGFRRDSFRLGPLGWSTSFPSLSEVAADRFAMALLRQSVHPKAVHFVVIYLHNPEYAWQLLERLRAMPA